MICRSARRRRAHRLAAAGSTALFALVAAAGPASAKQPGKDGAFCEGTLTPAFAAFGDTGLYALAPGGDFEADLTGWQLNGAQVADGSEPYAATGTAGLHSLALGDLGTVVSAPMCVDASRETFRFFVRNTGTKKTRLKVEAVFTGKNGKHLKTMNAGYVTSDVGTWQPTPILRNWASRVIPEGTTGEVAYRFTADGGSVAIDDLFIDPRFRA